MTATLDATPHSAAFSRASPTASAEVSVAITRKFSRFTARAQALLPQPQPRSQARPAASGSNVRPAPDVDAGAPPPQAAGQEELGVRARRGDAGFFEAFLGGAEGLGRCGWP